MSHAPAVPSAASGYADQRTEIVVDELQSSGSIPDWLTGSLLRTGPARWDLDGGSVRHWFDGQAMLHRFGFADGRVSYVNRKLMGRAGRAVEETGRLAFREFGTDPCRTLFQRVASLFDPGITDNGAVNIARIGDRWLALTEAPMAVRFDPRTLESLGVEPVGGKLGIAVAHPHHDGAELLGLRVSMGARTRYEITANDGASERVVASIPVRNPAYQHSFGLTPKHAIVVEAPFRANPMGMAVGGRPFIDNYRWRPEQGTTIRVVDRHTGDLAGSWTAPACFCFHHVNAFVEEDGTIVADLLAYDDAGIVQALELERLRRDAPVPAATLTRYRLRAGVAQAEVEPLVEERFELPRVHPRVNGRPYRYVWGIGSDGAGLFGHVVKVDVQQRSTLRWQEDGAFPGEPVFVPRPGGDDEDDGVLLSVVLEPARDASSLLVLDAHDLHEIGRAYVPQRVPFGFHGGYTERV